MRDSFVRMAPWGVLTRRKIATSANASPVNVKFMSRAIEVMSVMELPKAKTTHKKSTAMMPSQIIPPPETGRP